MQGARIIKYCTMMVSISFVLSLSTATIIPNMLISAYAFPHLAASGDWGCNSNTDQTVKSIKNHGATLTLGLGDYSYEDNSVTCWLNKVAPIDRR